MGLFDVFRKRVKKVAEDTDEDDLSAPEESDEAEAALAEREQLEQEVVEAEKAAETEAASTDDWEDIESIESEAPSPAPESTDEWDDWEDDPAPEPLSPTLSKKERKQAERERRQQEKERKRLMKQGFDVDQKVRPDGSRIDLHVMRSTTGRELVEVKHAPKGSVGVQKVVSDSGQDIEVDLGGGIVTRGGRVIKSGAALDALLDELELVLLEADMSRRSVDEVIGALRGELVGSRLRRGADLSKVIEAGLKRTLRAGIPSDLLRQRPDIDAAFQRIRAADARVQVAHADLFPSFALTASGGQSSSVLSDLARHGFSSWSVLGSLSQPLFDGGQRRAELGAAGKRAEQNYQHYRATVLNALREVENALGSERYLRTEEAARLQAFAAARSAETRTRRDFEAGITELLNLLLAQRQAFATEERTITLRAARLTNRVTLALALGKGL